MSESSLSFHSRGYRIASWVGAVFVIAVGVYLSRIEYMNTEWLSRAGCVVVMLGVWSGVGGIFQERLLYSRAKWRRKSALRAARARLKAEQSDEEKSEKVLAEINKAFDNHVKDAAQRIRLSIGVLEVSLLMTGTFLWGFGDLMMG
ncbi:hypothetical protein MIB92_12195 [Aestuariirhabdus sp. Z084]|uniref:hypothetical protein n=1 Tax=Aestuariirhabdus haliotis TaxID=2918751 RepID=UPI00201B3EFF|nr:hypothetical protein [Aestuariirhabdus haliotis]MCL6416414.1 hypothetical protein [Aestuariirhabdus haliotis]MCL6420420.1 hypothetical protein [Aestuariirhabdus haliotis]